MPTPEITAGSSWSSSHSSRWLYLLLAGTLELGPHDHDVANDQNAARVGARELAMVPLPPTATFRMRSSPR
jgi:hypothetical protein